MMKWMYTWVKYHTAQLMNEDAEFCRTYIDSCTDFRPMYSTNQERLDLGEKCVFMKPPNYLYVV